VDEREVDEDRVVLRIRLLGATQKCAAQGVHDVVGPLAEAPHAQALGSTRSDRKRGPTYSPIALHLLDLQSLGKRNGSLILPPPYRGCFYSNCYRMSVSDEQVPRR